MEKLMRSIAEDPELMQARPLIVNDKMEVLAGNQRLRACVALEWPTVPCVVVDWDEAKQRRAMIKDNVSAGEWDQDMLANEWEVEELKDMGLDLDWDEPEETEGLTDPDDVPGIPEEPTTKPGDLWILGEHRLLCGDSTKAEDVERLMGGEKADMVFTDPPYGMFLDTNYDSMFSSDASHRKTGKRFDTVKGDHEDFNPEFINTIFDAFDYCEEIFLWGADYYVDLIPKRNAGSWVVWDKRCDEKMDKVVGNTFELCWSKAKHKRMVARILWSGHHGMDKDDTKRRVHPTQKPVELVCWFFDNYSMADKHVVVDLFGGSGSTLIACEKTNRQSRLMELEPKYCDVIVKRWEEFTGKKAELWKQ